LEPDGEAVSISFFSMQFWANISNYNLYEAYTIYKA
jgi:hypothetical protein